MPRLFDIPDTAIHFIQKVVIFAWEGGAGGGEELHHRQVLQLLQLLRHVLIVGNQSIHESIMC